MLIVQRSGGLEVRVLDEASIAASSGLQLRDVIVCVDGVQAISVSFFLNI